MNKSRMTRFLQGSATASSSSVNQEEEEEEVLLLDEKELKGRGDACLARREAQYLRIMAFFVAFSLDLSRVYDSSASYSRPPLDLLEGYYR
jgi:hypothetical protein